MIPVKLDADKKFKWPDFKLISTALTPAEEQEVMRDVAGNYKDVLNSTLEYLKLPICSGSLYMTTYVTIEDKSYVNNPIFGLYKYEDIIKALDNASYDEQFKNYMKLLIPLNFYDKIGTYQKDIDKIKKKYKEECLATDLFVIDLVLFPIYNDPKKHNYVKHQNILVISKARGVVYWIEPQTTVDQTYEASMINSIKKLVTEIGMTNPTIINPVETCPQAIVGDKNCMFWAYVILFLILLNPQERDHNVLIKKFMEKYPTKELLNKYINGLKFLMLDPDKYKASAGKRRKTRRLKKHRTMRRR